MRAFEQRSNALVAAFQHALKRNLLSVHLFPGCGIGRDLAGFSSSQEDNVFGKACSVFTLSCKEYKLQRNSLKRISQRRIVCSSKGFGEKPTPRPQGKKGKQQGGSQSVPAKEFQPFLEDSENAERSQNVGQTVSSNIREVPEAINQRMLNRMLIFSLLPVFLGFLSLPLLAYIQVSQKVELPQGTAFVVSGFFFGAGLLGITYGILSASWNENDEGSSLGFEEFKSNTAPLLDKIKPKR